MIRGYLIPCCVVNRSRLTSITFNDSTIDYEWIFIAFDHMLMWTMSITSLPHFTPSAATLFLAVNIYIKENECIFMTDVIIRNALGCTNDLMELHCESYCGHSLRTEKLL